MNGFEASPAELQAAGALLDHVAEEVRGQATNLRGEVDGLLSDGWSGQAARGFAQGWREWERGANDVLSALSTMAELLGLTGRNYSEAEESTTDSAARTETAL